MEETKENNNNNNNKRSSGAMSPDEDLNLKLRKTTEITAVDTKTFNWDVLIRKMDTLLDRKLEKISTKEDITKIADDLTALAIKNAELEEEIKSLRESTEMLHNTVAEQQKRIEMLDKKSKRNSIVISGLSGGSYSAIKSEVDDIFANVLEVEVKPYFCTKLNKEGTKCSIEMSSPNDSQLVLQNCSKLKRTGKFIRKDLTAKEDKCRYHIRNLRRACIKKPNVNCRISGASIAIDGRQFYALEDGTISAKDEESASYLSNILTDVNASFKVCSPHMESTSRTGQ